MAIEAVIRRLLLGTRPSPGARSGVRALELNDYEALFKDRHIYTGFRRDEAHASLYRQVLGEAFEKLPPRLRELHGSAATRTWAGQASVRRGQGLVSRFVGAVFRFPQAAAQIPVTVSFAVQNKREVWTRDFGGVKFSSVQLTGTVKDQHLLLERFGIVEIGLALVLENNRLYFKPRSWSVFGICMPNALLPTGNSLETEENEKFCFNVEISTPITGLIAAYQGTLLPETTTGQHC